MLFQTAKKNIGLSQSKRWRQQFKDEKIFKIYNPNLTLKRIEIETKYSNRQHHENAH